ncbi:MAG: GIY-YIG nuclease family protein [Alphaproteobacteria bacterium]|nr:GIY-YIG nuclease family protein [Alphaproteobacteria bacterium]MCD8520295.1 GIY-YIG nuclease family protein [Alphaproteobacteria bacterium]MCD8570187.1 GIY-YIG nuclease family protein [Alphaproteobacteria bacterium]
MNQKYYYVYILTNKRYGTLYTGFTNDLQRRMIEHREEIFEGFTKKYGLKQLVYYERHEDILEGQKRERNIKEWKRLWKIEMIEKSNPHWFDLYDSFVKSIN